MRFSKLGASLLGALLAMALALIMVVRQDPLGIAIEPVPTPSPAASDAPPQPTAASRPPEVFVALDGQIEWDGAPLDRAELIPRLTSMAKRGYSIILSRAEPKVDPTEAQKAVLAEIQATGVTFQRVDRMP